MPYVPSQVALNAQPQDLQRNLDVAHVLEELANYYRLLVIPCWTGLRDEGNGGVADTRRVRLELRRAMRAPVPAATDIAAGDEVVDVTAAIAGDNDPAPDGTVGTEANYQETGLRVHFFCSGNATLDISGAGGAIGTEVSGGDTNHLIMLSGDSGGTGGQVVDIEVFDASAENVVVWALLEGMPCLRNIPLQATFA